MKVFAYMEHGVNKSHSEDTILANGLICKDGFICFDTPGKCIAIADGVGGNAGGQDASEFVCSALKQGIPDDAKDSALKINDALISYARTVQGKENMATTLTALLFDDKTPTRVIHVGNTRLCAIRGEYLKQLTRDHTAVEYFRLRGDYEAADNAAKNEITACFGGGSAALISQLQIFEIDRDYAGFVITSDGLHDHLDEEPLEDFVAEGIYTESAFEALVRQARKNGSVDDISIILLVFGSD